MTFYEYSVLEDGKLIANFSKEFKKDAISLAKTIKSMYPNKEIKVIKNNKYQTIHGYKPENIIVLGKMK